MNGSPSVKVALFIRNGGSESPCRWFYVTGIYSKRGNSKLSYSEIQDLYGSTEIKTEPMRKLQEA